ncbi:MAG: N-acetylmuramoyl-L-alanine amidase [Pseudomonadota bacterium]
MTSAEAALDRLCDPTYEVSAHYLIAEDGRAWHLVDDAHRAWHAGAGQWGGIQDVNSHSIGIELANDGATPFAEPQMMRLEGLLARLIGDHGIARHCVIGHSDMAPDRKQDPGRRFDWRRLACQNLAVWPEPGDSDAPFWESAQAFGYVPPADCPNPEELVLDAFRQRFRPWAFGAETELDRALMQDLARRYPVDRDPVVA